MADIFLSYASEDHLKDETISGYSSVTRILRFVAWKDVSRTNF